jgi:hypothetical protein
LLSVLQFALVVAVAAYLTTVRVALDRRNHYSWEQLVAQHDPGAGKRAAFWNASVLMKMVDYACQAEQPIDAALAEALRTEAMRVRLAAILAPTDWA